MNHTIDPYLRNPTHKITVGVIGAGGTGSQILQGLARINAALTSLDHAGLNVVVYDPDEITEANKARQLFSSQEVGMNKAIALATRINRFFGFGWHGAPTKFEGEKFSNIMITCVDSWKSREEFIKFSKKINKDDFGNSSKRPIYWIDCGNTRNTGQVWLSTMNGFNASNGTNKLKSLYQVYGKPEKEQEQGPSCSLAEALAKQDLFINTIVADAACQLVWQLFRFITIQHQGIFINMEHGLTIKPVQIQ